MRKFDIFQMVISGIALLVSVWMYRLCDNTDAIRIASVGVAVTAALWFIIIVEYILYKVISMK